MSLELMNIEDWDGKPCDWCGCPEFQHSCTYYLNDRVERLKNLLKRCIPHLRDLKIRQQMERQEYILETGYCEPENDYDTVMDGGFMEIEDDE